MRKKDKLIGIIVLSIVLPMLLCACPAGVYAGEGSIGVDVSVYSDEAYTNPITSGIIGTLRNDSISTEILDTVDVTIDGEIMFGISEGDFANDTYEGFDIQTEVNAMENETSAFYICINDEKSNSFNSLYKKINVPCNTPDVYGGEVNIYLPKSK